MEIVVVVFCLWGNRFKYWVCSTVVIESLWHVSLHTWALFVLCIEVVIKGIFLVCFICLFDFFFFFLGKRVDRKI